MKRGWEIWLSNPDKLNEDFESYVKRELIAKTEPSGRLAQAHIKKAFHNLDLASFIFDNQRDISKRITEETYNDGVIIFSYYAMYHSALALLYDIGFKSRSHLSTICVLCRNCPELDRKHIISISKALQLKNIREIGEGQKRREKASYDSSISFERHLAELTLEDARDFVNTVRSLLGTAP